MGDRYAGVSIKHGEGFRRNSQDARNRGNWSGGASGLDLTVDTEQYSPGVLRTDRQSENDRQKEKKKRGAERKPPGLDT